MNWTFRYIVKRLWASQTTLTISRYLLKITFDCVDCVECGNVFVLRRSPRLTFVIEHIRNLCGPRWTFMKFELIFGVFQLSSTAQCFHLQVVYQPTKHSATKENYTTTNCWMPTRLLCQLFLMSTQIDYDALQMHQQSTKLIWKAIEICFDSSQ